VTGDYVWDRTGFPDPEIVRLERLLKPLQYQPAPMATYASVPGIARARSRSSMVVVLATAAAVIALVIASGRETWFGGGSLAVTRLAGAPTIGARPMAEQGQLPAGHWLETGDDGRASIDIGNVGRVEVSPRTRLGLLGAKPGDYRMDLAKGTMTAVITAPPGQFSVKTPSSTAVDLGCIYTMTVDEDGTGTVRVTMGWVGFEWRGRESFIPAGAVCQTRPVLGPGTPHYEDTSEAFRAALTTIDLRAGSPEGREAALNVVLTEARLRDAVTLWHLLSRVDAAKVDRVYARLAEFVPPPAGVTVDGIRARKREMLDLWWDKLDLGTAQWWRMWRQQWRDNTAGR